MSQDSDFEPLEKIVGQGLRTLTPLKAPPGFSSSVLNKIREGPELAWWQQSIWCWPPLARAAFLFAALMVLLVVSGGGWFATPDAQSWSGAADKLGEVSALGTIAMTVGGWLVTLWERSFQPWLPYLLGGAAVAYLLCLGLGTAVVRYAFRHS